MQIEKLITLVFGFILSITLKGQVPSLVKEWDKSFGGNKTDKLFAFAPTTDGGYILGGWSSSDSSGDKSQPLTEGEWGIDFWIVKVNSMGSKEWDKSFGGNGIDVLSSLQQTLDGGYILGGWSNSDSSGDKSQHCWGEPDYWVIKIDSIGNKRWDKRFGGTEYDQLFSVQQTNDKGYILGGWSGSDSITGDNSQASRGLNDYWIVKIDSIGYKQWDKRFGGSQSEELSSIYQTSDGGYILGGSSNSGLGGDRTQPSWGTHDFWLVKTDLNGNKQWDKRYGGANTDMLFSMQKTIDGGFILGGYSISQSGGDKTDSLQGEEGYSDYWIVKIDSLGNKQWDRDFGGTYYESCCFPYNEERLYISQAHDKGYLITGNSWSSKSGDKSESNLNGTQIWVVKTDSLGMKQWDKTIFTITNDEYPAFTIETDSGCYIIITSTLSEIGGYKTQFSEGMVDFWMTKFCECNMPYCSCFSANVDSIISNDTVYVGQENPLTTYPGYLYTWSATNGSIYSRYDGSVISVHWHTPGIDTVQVIVSNDSCSHTISKTITILNPTNGDENQPELFSVYPNPTNTLIRLKAGEAAAQFTIHIYDTFGKKVEQIIPTTELQNGFELNLTTLPSGVYFIHARNSESSAVFKVMKL